MRKKVTPETLREFMQKLAAHAPRHRPALSGPVEHALYELLEQKYNEDAYGRYNSLLRRMNSFARALEWERSKRGRQ